MRKKYFLYGIIILCFFILGCTDVQSRDEGDVATETDVSQVSENVLEEERENLTNNYEQFGEIVNGVQAIEGETWEDIEKIANQIDEYALLVGSWNGEYKILYNGAHYESLVQDESFILIGKDMAEAENMFITIANEKCVAYNLDIDYAYPVSVNIETTGEDIPVPIRIVHQNGTIDYITVYISKEWKGWMEEFTEDESEMQ